jgi:peptidylprolyl isomerase
MSQAKDGDSVRVHFTGKTDDGNVFASSYGQEPLEFRIGEGQMLPGIEKAITGMNVGEQKITYLSPEDGYGPHMQELILEVEKKEFPKGFNPEVGMMLQVPQPDGLTAILTILAVEEKLVKLDANHPLAGKNLTFELELLEIF